jgi:photosystem II stability/assembly factor-like uncharacterized protein
MKISNLAKLTTLIVLYSLKVPFTFSQTGINGTVTALAVDSAPNPIIYAGTEQGLYMSNNHGSNWTSLGLTDHSIREILIHPSVENVIYIATDNHGILKTTNGGKDWDVLLQESADPALNKGLKDLRALAIDSTNPSILYAGNFAGYILKSIDQGKTWSTLNPEFPLIALNTLALHPSNQKIIYVGLGGRGVLKSTDAGATWNEINNGLLDKTVTRLVIDSHRPDTLYVGTYGGGVFVSEDNGDSWSPANTGLSDRFIYSLAVFRESLDATRNEGFFDKLTQKIGRIAEGHSSAELLAGVFGGNLFRGSGTGELRWEPIAEN